MNRWSVLAPKMASATAVRGVPMSIIVRSARSVGSGALTSTKRRVHSMYRSGRVSSVSNGNRSKLTAWPAVARAT